MNEAAIAAYITGTFDGVNVVDNWGDTFFFYNPDTSQPDEFYFATLKSSDDEYDRFSDLNRPSVFRLNIGVGKETYRRFFGAPLPRPTADGDIDADYDFTVLDQLLPHPVYGRMHWVCILNPSEATFRETVQPLLAEAYQLTVDRYAKRAARG